MLTVAVLPASMRKAQRGYALAQNVVHAPLKAHAVRFRSGWSVTEVSRQIFCEQFNQFTSNDLALGHPELVHQGRVGWQCCKGTGASVRSCVVAGRSDRLGCTEAARATVWRLRERWTWPDSRSMRVCCPVCAV